MHVGRVILKSIKINDIVYILFDMFFCIYTIVTSRTMDKIRIGRLQKLIDNFLELFPKVYGWFNLTINFHKLGHLPMLLDFFGPLTSHQLDSFERSNGIIADGTRNTSGRNIAEDLQCKFYFKRMLDLQMIKDDIPSHVRNLFLKNNSNQKWFMRGASIEDIAYFQRNRSLFKGDELLPCGSGPEGAFKKIILIQDDKDCLEELLSDSVYKELPIPNEISAFCYRKFRIADEYYSSSMAKKVGGRFAVTVFQDRNNLTPYLCEIKCFLIIELFGKTFQLCKVQYFKNRPKNFKHNLKEIREVLAIKKGFLQSSTQDIIPVHCLLRRAIFMEDYALLLAPKIRS